MLDQYAQRRQQVMEKMDKNSIAIMPSAKVLERNFDNDFPFRQSSDFYYLTGFREADAVLVLMPGRPEGEFILFNQPKDPAVEVWTGKRAGQQGAVKDVGANQSFAITELGARMPELLAGCDRLYYTVGNDEQFDQQLITWLEGVRRQVRKGVRAPSQIIDFNDIVHECRLVKSDDELALIRQSTTISADAMVRAMQAAKPGMYEYQIEAELRHHYLCHGSQDVAYPPIVATGGNACVLHYTANNSQLKSGDLLLIDAGGEYQYYASDITRTFPVNGKFTPEQKAIYELVLAAQTSTIAMVKPGVPWPQLQENAIKVITQGLIELDILSGKLDDLIANKSYAKFYMHNIGHWMGLDTHDVGSYRLGHEWRKINVGYVFTVEPGIYIPAGSEVDEKWWNIGVRIEDDILVTANGCEVLTANAPKTVADIEALLAAKG